MEFPPFVALPSGSLCLGVFLPSFSNLLGLLCWGGSWQKAHLTIWKQAAEMIIRVDDIIKIFGSEGVEFANPTV